METTFDYIKRLSTDVAKDLKSFKNSPFLESIIYDDYMVLRKGIADTLREFKKYAELQKEITDTLAMARKAKQRNNHEGVNILHAKAEALTIELAGLTDYWLKELTETKTAQQGELFQ